MEEEEETLVFHQADSIRFPDVDLLENLCKLNVLDAKTEQWLSVSSLLEGGATVDGGDKGSVLVWIRHFG